jgi:hypothetical protein
MEALANKTEGYIASELHLGQMLFADLPITTGEVARFDFFDDVLSDIAEQTVSIYNGLANR